MTAADNLRTNWISIIKDALDFTSTIDFRNLLTILTLSHPSFKKNETTSEQADASCATEVFKFSESIGYISNLTYFSFLALNKKRYFRVDDLLVEHWDFHFKKVLEHLALEWEEVLNYEQILMIVFVNPIMYFSLTLTTCCPEQAQREKDGGEPAILLQFHSPSIIKILTTRTT